MAQLPLQGAITRISQDIRQTETDIAQSKEDILQNKTDTDAALVQLREDIEEDIVPKIEAVREEINDEILPKIEEVQNSVDILDQALENQLGEMDKRLDEFRSEPDPVEAVVTKLEEAIEEAQKRIDELKGTAKIMWRFDIPPMGMSSDPADDPLQQMLTEHWTTVRGVPPSTGATIINLNQGSPVEGTDHNSGHSWTFLQDTDTYFRWIDRGADTVNIARPTVPGIVLGENSNPQIKMPIIFDGTGAGRVRNADQLLTGIVPEVRIEDLTSSQIRYWKEFDTVSLDPTIITEKWCEAMGVSSSTTPPTGAKIRVLPYLWEAGQPSAVLRWGSEWFIIKIDDPLRLQRNNIHNPMSWDSHTTIMTATTFDQGRRPIPFGNRLYGYRIRTVDPLQNQLNSGSITTFLFFSAVILETNASFRPEWWNRNCSVITSLTGGLLKQHSASPTPVTSANNVIAMLNIGIQGFEWWDTHLPNPPSGSIGFDNALEFYATSGVGAWYNTMTPAVSFSSGPWVSSWYPHTSWFTRDLWVVYHNPLGPFDWEKDYI
jgi:hypothetical protein